MGRRSGSRVLAAVLFTDIVDSTMHASQIGDRRWKELIGRHHAIVRRELKRFGGRELDTAGDGFFASFGEPAAAIRCACAASEAVRQLGIEIRAGVHFGECEQVGGKLGGLTVVVGARVMSLAGAGEVLITGSTRELIGGAGLGFEDRGLHALKGVDGEWHVFAVTEVDGTSRPEPMQAREAEEHLAAIQATGGSRLTPRKLVAIGAAFLIPVLIAVPWAAHRTKGSSAIEPNSMGVLDPDSGEVIGSVLLETRPGAVAASGDSVWVTSPDAGRVTEIDPSERTIRDDVQVGEGPTGIAVGLGAVWVLESGGPSVSRVNADTGEVVDTIPVGNGATHLVAGEGGVWVTNRFDGTVSRIGPDPATRVQVIPVGAEPQGIAIGFESVWVGVAGSNTVVRIDPATNEAIDSIGVGNGPGSLAVSGDSLWVANTLDDTVMRIDPDTNTVVETVPVGDGPSGIVLVGDVVWVANEGDGTISRIEPGEASGQTSVRGIAIGSVPQGLAAVNGDLWVSVRGTATSHRGGTLRLMSIERPTALDSTYNYEPVAYRVQHLMGDGLVAFEPIGGTSTTLVPDLATSIPTPTGDGTVYTFHLRPDIRYSDGEIVAPEDFRRALERVFRLRSGGDFLYEGIVGAGACMKDPQRCDLSRGIETPEESGTITFHLVEPDPQFLDKLTLSLAFPAPPSVPVEHQARAGIPGTGPYMLAGPMTGEGLTLVRNPSFRVWSEQAQPDGYVDRIEWTFGVDPEAQVDAVITGDVDVALDASRSERLDEILVEHGDLVRTASQASTYYFTFRTQLPPFDRVEVRRAVNLALDRDRFVDLLGGDAAARPTCQQLPPNFPGYRPFCPYTVDPGEDGEGSWTAPDTDRAKEIVRRSGTAGMPVVFSYFADSTPSGVPDYILGLLDDLGYRGSAKALGPKDEPGPEVQMVLAGWTADYPAAANFFDDLVTCHASASYDGEFCRGRIDRMVDAATTMQLEDPAAAVPLWAEVDRAVVAEAPYLWLANPISLHLVSERVGNYQWSGQWNVLLNQIWVR